jgi:hypothetical protein
MKSSAADGRRAIIDEDAKRNINPTFPPLVPWARINDGC